MPKSLLKGSLNTILLKLLQENGPMYGYEITKNVKQLTKGSIQLTEGALYPALHKLEAEGLVSTTMKEVDNRKRKYYSLTSRGKTASVKKLKELAAFVAQIENILNLKLSLR